MFCYIEECGNVVVCQSISSFISYSIDLNYAVIKHLACTSSGHEYDHAAVEMSHIVVQNIFFTILVKLSSCIKS